MDSFDWLRSVGEKMKPHCDTKKDTNLSLKRRIRNKWFYSKYTHPRRYWGRKILGNPRRGQGVLMQVDLGMKTKEEVDAFWLALKYLRAAGISFDTGMGCQFDMELDWSLNGAIVKCKKCGYNSEKNRIDLDNWNAKERFTVPCTKCCLLIDSKDGFWKVKPHFWNRTKYYHAKCHQSESLLKYDCIQGKGGCSNCINGFT